MAVLARQGTATNQPWSLTRDSQLRTLLESGLDGALGRGVVAGGMITKVAAYTVRIPSGTRFFLEGMDLTLSANSDYNSVPVGTSYLWGTITRTAANQSLPATSDTYALAVTHNLTGVAPSALHFPIAIIVADGTGIQTYDNAVEGKMLRTLRRLQTNAHTIASTEAVVIPAGEQAVLWKELTVNGVLGVNGYLHIIGEA